MDVTIATEIAYKNGAKAGKEEILKEIMKIYEDLSKICDAAAGEGIVEAWQDLRMILVKNGIQLP